MDCSNDQQWIEKNVTDFHNKQLTESYCKWCTDRTHITWFLNDKFLLINGFKFAAVLFMIFLDKDSFCGFASVHQPRNQDVIGVQIFSFNSRGFTQVSQ